MEGYLLYSIVLVSAKHQHESAIDVLMSSPSSASLSPLPPLPPYVVTELQFEFPESLAICFTYGNVRFHVTLSIQPSLSSFPYTVFLSLFSMSMSPLLPCI